METLFWIIVPIETFILCFIFKKYRLVPSKGARAVATVLALLAHRDQKDKVGAEYKWHLDRVARNVKSDSAKIVAWLHDIVEDNWLTHEELKALGVFTDEELYAIRALDKKCMGGFGLDQTWKLSDREWGRMHLISDCQLAKEVKIADLKDNLDATRFLKAGVEITVWDKERFQKYESQLSYLEGR